MTDLLINSMSPGAVISLLLLVLVSGDSEAEAQIGGSGEQYLKKTEDRWDGKTAWFTGSSEFKSGFRNIVTRFWKAVTVTGGPPDASSMRNCTDKLGMVCSVFSVGETGVLVTHSKDHVFNFLYLRDGAHCEKCRQNFYLAAGPDSLDYMDTVSSLSRGQACVPCQCHPEGSEAGQCEAGSGQCPCRPGLTGRRCDACEEKSWNFPLCRPCACLPAGTRGGAEGCGESGSGCQCKHFVKGTNCDQCVQGYFEVCGSALRQ